MYELRSDLCLSRMGRGNFCGRRPPRLGVADTGMGKAEGWKSPLSPGDLRSQELGCELLKEHERPGGKKLHTFLVVPSSATKGGRRRSYHQIQEFCITFKNTLRNQVLLLRGMLSWHVKSSSIEFLAKNKTNQTKTHYKQKKLIISLVFSGKP